MQFIEGQTLAQIIADCGLRIADCGLRIQRRRSPRAPMQRQPVRPRPPLPSNPRSAIRNPQWAGPPPLLSTARSVSSPAYYSTVARLGIQAAEALDFAHQQGIVHRDVKPANLLVDDDGRLWVTNFGLAQVQGDHRVTMTGDLVGTLRYMSPEQALAKRAVVDHRTDVYSLGVTLYELLTLEPAFGASDRQELLRQIAFDEPVAPRRRNKAIPAELETIVLKAMEKDATARYATAQDVADDLRRFLDQRPIQARRPTLAVRVGKWARRHRALVRTAVAALALVAVVATVSAVLIWRAWQAESRARAAEAEQRREAEASRAEARQAVDDMHTRVAESVLAGLPHVQPLQRELLEKALRFYQKEVATRLGQPDTESELARTYFRIGSIERLLGRSAEAEASTREAVARFERLAAAEPADLDRQAALARGQRLLGMILTDAGQVPQAEAAYAAAVQTWAGLSERDPARKERYLFRLAQARAGLGFVAARQGRWAKAEALHRSAAADLAPLAGRRSVPEEVRFTLLQSHQGRGEALLNLRRLPETAGVLREAVTLGEGLVRGMPAEPALRATCASCWDALAVVLQELQPGPAEREAEAKAVALMERLAADYPDVPEYARQLADMTWNTAVVATRQSRTQDALHAYQRIHSIARGLRARFPESTEDRYRLARCLADWGHTLLAELNRPAQAGQRLAEALDIAGELAGASPTNVEYAALLGRCRLELGDALDRTGRTPEAVQLWRQVVDSAPRAGPVADHPDCRHAVAQALHRIGIRHMAGGHRDQAEAAYRQAAALLEPLVKQYPHRSPFRVSLAYLLGAWANALTEPEPARAERTYLRSRDLLRRLVKELPGNLGHRQQLATYLERLAQVALLRTNHPDTALTAWQEALALRQALPAGVRDVPESLTTLAIDHLNVAVLLKGQGQLVDAKNHLRRAVALPAQLPRGTAWANQVPLARCHLLLGTVLQGEGRRAEAVRELRAALAGEPGNAAALNTLAWVLATAPEADLRDPREAVRHARQAVKASPADPGYLNTLGVACYYAGDWQGAVEGLNNAVQLRKGGTGCDWLFLAMAHWRLGHKDEARRWYEKAETGMDKNRAQDEELRRFHAEAAALLGRATETPRGVTKR
jgi:tetratricopeptide (TPR) repeat protein